MAANRHEPAVGAARQPAREPDVDERLDRLDAVRVLREPHRPDEHGVRPLDEQPREGLHAVARGAALTLEIVPAGGERAVARRLEARRALAHERLVHAVRLDERAKDADEKREIAAGVDVEPVVGERRAEERAGGDRRNPVALEPRLAVRVHDRNARAVLLRVVEVLRRHRLVVGGVRSEQHDEIRVQPVHVAARGRAVAERRLHRGGGCGVAEPRGVVDVVRAEEARRLLRRVVDLVRDPARGEIERGAPRIGRAQRGADAIERLVPRDDAEAAVAAAAHHRLPEAAERAQIVRRAARERIDVGEHRRIERRRRVEPHQLQPHHAEVDAVERPVGKARRAERAAVADAVVQNAPGERQLIAVLPCDGEHFAVVARLLAPEAEHVTLRRRFRCPQRCAPRTNPTSVTP